MKILLVNDDGLNSEGILQLEKILSQKGHEVWVCAPDSQRSASSHAIHLSNVKIKKISERHYSCDGFPADCVLYPLLGAIPIGRPDVVVSGINHGFNISTDRVYSGTVGAAEEGALKGIPSIAVSCEKVVKEEGSMPEKRIFEDFPFTDAAMFIADHIQQFHDQCKPGYFYNVNVPDNAHGVWTYTGRGSLEFYDEIVQSEDPEIFSIRGYAFPEVESDKKEETDYFAVFAKNVISVTIMKSDT